MQIVIEIDKEYYEKLRQHPTSMLSDVKIAIRNGTPLPQGHGRLGDLDELYERIDRYMLRHKRAFDEYTLAHIKHILEGIRQTDTVIEASKGE